MALASPAWLAPAHQLQPAARFGVKRALGQVNLVQRRGFPRIEASHVIAPGKELVAQPCPQMLQSCLGTLRKGKTDAGPYG